MKLLGLFAKHWRPGRVKTRLATTLGTERASRLYQVFLDHLLETLAETGDQREIVFTPQSARSEFARRGGSAWRLVPQVEGDLGDRMASYFQQRFEPSYETGPDRSDPPRIIVIGADCPQLLPSDLEEAFDALQTQDVVLGPASDGGYYLIGFRGQARPIFSGVPWSTDRVMATTESLIRDGGWSLHRLPTRTDVDELPDLIGLWRELGVSPTAAPWRRLRTALAPYLDSLPESAAQ